MADSGEPEISDEDLSGIAHHDVRRLNVLGMRRGLQADQ